MNLEIGQIWQEVDPRFTRKVKIVGFDGPKAIIQTGYWKDGRWVKVRTTLARPDRFNGKRGGYKLITERTEQDAR